VALKKQPAYDIDSVSGSMQVDFWDGQVGCCNYKEK
jgi:hypothetical protein